MAGLGLGIAIPFARRGAAAANVLIYDSFTEASITGIVSHTPDEVVAPATTPWVQPITRFQVGTTGSLELTGGGSGDQLCWINSGTADGIIACSNLRSTGTLMCLAFRVQDGDNYWAVRNNNNNIDLVEYVSGAFNLRASFNTGVTGTRARVAVIASGSSISVYLDGTLVISHTSTAKQTLTNHGFMSLGSGTAGDDVADDFTVIDSTDAGDLP